MEAVANVKSEAAETKEEKSGKGVATFTDADVTAFMNLVKGTWENEVKEGVVNPHKKIVRNKEGEDVFTGSKKDCEQYILDHPTAKLEVIDITRDLFGKQCKQSAEEIAKALSTDDRKIDTTTVNNIVKAAENKARHLGGKAMKDAGKDPSCYKIWTKRVGGGRGNSKFDESLNLSAADLF